MMDRTELYPRVLRIGCLREGPVALFATGPFFMAEFLAWSAFRLVCSLDSKHFNHSHEVG
jgi:hypothetical protein